MELLLQILFIILCATSTQALIAYDCAGANLNVTSISLLDVAECPNYVTERVDDNIEVQVLQEKETYAIHIYQCLIEMDYHVTHCGMHSHASEVEGGYGRHFWQLSPSECIIVHRNREFTLYGHRITALLPNSSSSHAVTLAGTVNIDSDCTQGSITIGSRSWSNILATAVVTITISDHTGIMRVDDDVVISRSGVSCKYSDKFCIDAQEGYLTWDNVELADCSRTSYQVLYRGYVSKIYVKSELAKSDTYTLYSIQDDKFLATLMYKSTKTICGIQTVVTDHPKLLIQEIRNGMTYFEQSKIDTYNMDIFLYVNAKFTHLEQHMRRQLSKMYEIIVRDQCETRRQLLKTQLSVATMDPVEFAYIFTGKPGHTGITIGEQVHVIQCTPVSVSASVMTGCYNELSVNHSGVIYYMAPKTHILQKVPTPVTCSVLLKPTFRLSGSWFSSHAGLTHVSPPTTLTTQSDVIWTYTDAGNLASEGIYSYSDINKLRNQIMYPSERKAITQTISSAINEDSVGVDSDMFKNLMSKDVIKSTFKEFYEGLWERFLVFGNVFSGVFGILLVFKIIKWLFDTLIHSKGLYEVYGCGWKLLASFWDAATTYLLSPRNVARHTQATSDQSQPAVEMTLLEKALTSPELYPDLQCPPSVVVEPSAPSTRHYPKLPKMTSRK